MSIKPVQVGSSSSALLRFDQYQLEPLVRTLSSALVQSLLAGVIHSNMFSTNMRQIDRGTDTFVERKYKDFISMKSCDEEYNRA